MVTAEMWFSTRRSRVLVPLRTLMVEQDAKYLREDGIQRETIAGHKWMRFLKIFIRYVRRSHEHFLLSKASAVLEPGPAASLVGSEEAIDAACGNRRRLRSTQCFARVRLREGRLTPPDRSHCYSLRAPPDVMSGGAFGFFCKETLPRSPAKSHDKKTPGVPVGLPRG